jgi:four helix bundle protein
LTIDNLTAPGGAEREDVAITPEEMKRRIRDFALRCLRFATTFPKGPAGDVIGRQLIRACTGAAANYRAACIARSRADFASKLGVVEEEADESVFWIGFAADAALAKRQQVAALLAEGEEIVRIVAKSRITAKRPAAGAPREGSSRPQPGNF